MAHEQQQNFVKSVIDKYPEIFNGAKILEVGSHNTNGTIRTLIHSASEYIGIDVGEGTDVDLVVAGQDYTGPSNYFDACLSAECFEHNPYWFETFTNMIRVCRTNGLVCFTCATTGRPVHGLSPSDTLLSKALWNDYYRNLTEEDFTSKINFDEYFTEWKFSIEYSTKDLYFYGLKK